MSNTSYCVEDLSRLALASVNRLYNLPVYAISTITNRPAAYTGHTNKLRGECPGYVRSN